LDVPTIVLDRAGVAERETQHELKARHELAAGGGA